MTDYLEALLEAQERDEAEEDGVLELPGETTARRRTGRGADADGETGGTVRAEIAGTVEEAGAEEAGAEEARETGSGREALPTTAGTVGVEWLLRRGDAAETAARRAAVREDGTAARAGRRAETARDAGCGAGMAAASGAAAQAAGRGAEVTADGLRLADAERAAGAAWLYRQVRRGEAAVTAPLWAARYDPAPVGGGTAGGGLSARDLDRLVEQDARRYDGGFTLF